MKSKYTVPFAIIVAGIILAVAVYTIVAQEHSAAVAHGSHPSLIRPVSANDHVFGNPAAPVKIIEYSDFSCAYCKNFNDTLHEIIATAGVNGQVAWVFREFPLTEIHPNAFMLARAAECAGVVGGNDGFWKFADELFAHQPAESSQFGAYASATGIPSDKFASCYADAASTVDARINADRQNALDVGAQGAPYSVILAPGQSPIVMDGAYSYDAVKQLVDTALQTAGVKAQ